ncbi:MAG: hypothetical protein LBO74_08165 [Candidatus Symbiothrix sp.]|jgi:hypothetical protein|nr:hypothetical protein [Candidatus Symbiothrix sp.]
MKKILLVGLALLVWGVTTGKAQVRIGDNNNPTQGAVLDLNTSVYKGGLLLPQVALLTIDDVTDLTASPVSAGDLKGLMVYNTTPATEGVYVWIWDETELTGEWVALWKK